MRLAAVHPQRKEHPLAPCPLIARLALGVREVGKQEERVREGKEVESS